VRVARCTGCGSRLAEDVVRCPACGLDLSAEPLPLETGPGNDVAEARRLPLGVLLVAAAAVAVAAGVFNSPRPDKGAASPPAPPPLMGPVADVSEPGRVWPPAGPYEGGQNNAAVWTGSELVLWRGAEAGRNLDGAVYRP
jgi:hypothetical protein